MKTTIIANGTRAQLVCVPESDLEKAYVRALGDNEIEATVKRGEYLPIGAAPGAQTAIIITIPYSKDKVPGGTGEPKES